MATRQETNPGASRLAEAYSSSCRAHGYSEAIRMAYIATHLFDSTAKCGNGVQSDAGIASAFHIAIHVGYLYAGNEPCEARSTGGSAVVGLVFRQF